MRKKSKYLLGSIFFIWVIAVLFIYFFQFVTNTGECSLGKGCIALFHHQYKIVLLESHQYYYDALLTNFGFSKGLTHFSGPVLYIIGGLLFLYAANFLYEVIIEKKRSLCVNLAPIGYFALFTLVFFLINNRWVSYFSLQSAAKYPSIYYKYFVYMIELFVILFVTLTIGKGIKRLFFKEKSDDSAELLYSFGFGSSFLIIISYFLAVFNSFKFWPLVALFIVMTVLFCKEALFWLKKIFVEKIGFDLKYFDPTIFLFLFLVVIIAHNLLDLFRPIPMGFDDLGVYMNNANLMANYGHLTVGSMSYFWEIFTALGVVLYKDITISLLLAFLVGIFAIIAVYSVTKRYLTNRGLTDLLVRRYSMLSAAIFYSLPCIIFQSSRDMKVDIAGMFFSLIALLVFWQWRECYLSNRKASNYLLISAIFAGFAFAIKYTNILFIITMLCYLAITIFKKHGFKLRKFLLCFSFLVISLIPVMPISIRNIYQTKSLSISSIRFGDDKSQKIVLDPAFSSDKGLNPNYESYMAKNETGNREEAQRYLGYESGLKKYLLLPYRLTANTLTQGLYVDMGFLFLLFVPFGFIFLIKKDKDKKIKYFKEIFLLGAVYWLMWMFSASGIIWYGLSGYIFLLLIAIEMIIKFSDIRFIRYISGLVIVFWLTCSLFIRSTTLPAAGIGIDEDNVRFSHGEIDKEIYIEDRFKPYMETIKEINKDIVAHSDNPPRVYRVGTFYKFFITDNDKTVIDDQMLDKFTFASQDKDDQKLLERLKNNNIRYFIIDRDLVKVDSTPEKSYIKKYQNFLNFFERNSDHFTLLSDQFDTRVLIIEYRP